VQTVWTTDAGLPQTSIYSIAQTRDGFLWVGTEQGLASFDGVRFRVFNRDNVPLLPANYIHRLLAARDGSLWIGTDSGLTHYKDGVWTTWTEKNGLSDDDIEALAEGRDGSLWIGTDQGLDRMLNGRVDVWHTASGLPNEHVTALAVDWSGLLWVATHGGLASFDGSRLTSYPGVQKPAGSALSALAIAANGAVWTASTDGQLSRVADGILSPVPVHLPANDVDAMLFDRDGNLWMGFQNRGLARLRDGVVTLEDTQNGLPGQTVDALLEDAEHSLWVGTFDGGLVQLRDGKFTVYGKPEGIHAGVICCSAEARDGTVWVGTAAGELSEIQPDGKRRTYTARDGLAPEGIHSMLLGRDGTLWIGHRHGMLTRSRNGRFQSFKDERAKNHAINGLLEDRAGKLWIGTYGAGVARFENREFVEVLPKLAAPVMVETADGAIWLGSDGDGVFQLKNGVIAHHYTKAEGLINDHVTALWADREGVLWVGLMAGGLNRIRNGKISSFTTANGLFNATVANLMGDNFGNLWMGSDSGISRVAKGELEQFAEGKITAFHSVAYDTADGLRSRETMQGGVGCGSKGADGRLWFPTMNGLAVVDPARALEPDLPLPVRIESVKFGGRGVPLGHNLRLGAGTDRLSIQFTTTSFVAPTLIRFRYQLEGYDQNWIEVGSARSASYTNLSPGSYRFRVEAGRHNGEWGAEAESLQFTISAPWYRTTAAWCLWTLFALLGTWQIVRLRTAQLLQRRRELERMVAERTIQLNAEKVALATAREQLQLQATRDALTGVWNRGVILGRLEQGVERARRDGTVLGVVMADLDHFKQINDDYGHVCGDHVLKEVAERLTSCLRGYDSIGRYGGEEFLILMPGCDFENNPGRLDDLLKSIQERPFVDGEREFRSTCSFGATVLRPGQILSSAEESLIAADRALYEAKERGRNRVEVSGLPGAKNDQASVSRR
jgi:diguanylate cyclase (GGDEF)-like protein